MTAIQNKLAPVREGREVVLSESYAAFLITTLGPVLVTILGGGLLGVMKGGLWWAIPGAAAVILMVILIWGVLRNSPRVRISSTGVTCADRAFHWTEIESFGADRAEYVPDWVFLTDSGGDQHELGSTFGFKAVELRDALNELLCEFHPESSRAQHEADRESDAVTAEALKIRFQPPSGPDDAIEQARQLIGRYYHPDCDTVTEVSERIVEAAALDPHAFPLHVTECAGCGDAPMQEVVLDNGQTLQDVFRQMQKAVPVKAQLGKFFLFAAVLCPLGIAIGLNIPVPRNGWLLGLLGGGGGFLVGILLSLLMYRRLRRAGWMW